MDEPYLDDLNADESHADQPYSAAVLAGGRSSRFGVDKARYELGGKTLLAHVLNSFPGPAERFVVANRAYPAAGVPVYGDRIVGGDSLSGLHAALYHANEAWVAVAACDLPYLTPAYWRLLLSRRGHEPVVVVKGERLEPLAALYHVSLLPLVTQQLETGQLRVSALAEQVPARHLDYRDVVTVCGPHVLANLNRPPAP